jgi:hypothetical protein
MIGKIARRLFEILRIYPPPALISRRGIVQAGAQQCLMMGVVRTLPARPSRYDTEHPRTTLHRAVKYTQHSARLAGPARGRPSNLAAKASASLTRWFRDPAMDLEDASPGTFRTKTVVGERSSPCGLDPCRFGSTPVVASTEGDSDENPCPLSLPPWRLLGV